MKKKRLKLVLFAALALFSAIGGWLFSQSLPILHPEEGRNVAHAAPGYEEGCAICHLSPIPYTNCTDSGCHTAPSATIGNNIYLKHHEVADGCDVCHAAVPNDARYVIIPDSGHEFCKTCHSQMTHEQS